MTAPAPEPLFFFDYIDPASLLLERRISEAEETLGRAVRRRPFEVRPPPMPLLDPDEPAWRAYWSEVAAVAEADGLSLRKPALVPWTRKAHELALQARARDRFAEVHRALFVAFLLEGRDIGRVDVLTDVAVAHGLDWTETRAVLDVDRHAEEVAQERAEAERRGIRGVPTLRAGDRSLEGLHDTGTILAFLEGR